MKKREVLKELQAKYDELEQEYKVAREDVLAFEGDAEYEEYMKLEDDAARKEKFPIQYAAHEKMSELEAKGEELEKEILSVAKDLNKELDETLADLEQKMQTAKEQREQLSKETDEINKELQALKKSEQYKNGDEDTVKQVEELEEKLRKNRSNKGKLTKTINALAKEIEGVKAEKEQLAEEYGEGILVSETAPSTEQPVAEENEISEEEQAKQEEPQQDEEKRKQEIAEKQKEIKQIDEQIASLQAELPDLTKQYDELMKEVQDKNKEIVALKSSDSYKKGDKATLLKVEELEKELQDKVAAKDWVLARLSAIRKVVPALQEKKKQIVEQYGEEVLNYPKEQVKKQQDTKEVKKDETKHPKKESAHVVYSGAGEEKVDKKEEPKAQEEKKIDEKQEFNDLYSKAKRGSLTEQEFSRLAEIMKDTKNYDKYGITTGIVFNKSKVILKAMAKMAADTKQTARLTREQLGIKVNNATEENGYMATSEIKSWKGLKNLMNNPNQEIASEVVFRQVVQIDRESLTDEQKLVWDKAKSHLNKFDELKSCLNAYGTVSKQRMQKQWSWLFEFKEDEAKPLPAAPATTEKTSSKGLNLETMVKDTPDDSEIKPREASIDSKNKDAR